MSSESKVRAVSAALQAKGFDLGQYQRDTERRLKIRSDVAAGALAFAASRGDPLPGLLLRLKYAGERSEEAFARAQGLLVHRHGGTHRSTSGTLRAVAFAAVLEWCHDACKKCRARREKTAHAVDCGCVKEGYYLGVETLSGLRQKWAPGPRPGCAKCRGMGRLFRPLDRDKGVACVTCRNSGRISFEGRERWRTVSEIIVAGQRACGAPMERMEFKVFQHGWHTRYRYFLDVLRMTDRHMIGFDLNFGFRASEPFTPLSDGGVIARTETAPANEEEAGGPE